MTEHVLDDLQVRPRGESKAGRSMAQIMQADGRQARSLPNVWIYTKRVHLASRA